MVQNCLGFLLGLSCLFWLENAQQSTVSIVLSLLILLSFRFIRTVSFRKQFIAPLLGLLWGSCTASLWLFTTPALLSSPKIADIKGYICSLPVQNNSASFYNSDEDQISIRLTFDFCLSQMGDKTLSFYHANKVRLSVYQVSNEQINQMKAGSFWQLSAKLKPIHGRMNPGGFDYEKWLVSEGFIGTGYVKSSVLTPSAISVNAFYHSVRQTILDKLNRVIPDTDSKGMALALAIGERSSISAEQWQTIKDSGTSHLLAISGLHIGIAALWSYYLCLIIFSRLTFISQKIPAQKIAEVASLIGGLSIALLSGFGYPAQRALMMLVVFLYSRWSARHLSLANVLALSVMIIAFIQPFAVLTVSFWLSILAVAIIVLLLSYKQNFSHGNVKLIEWLRINWFLFVGLMPITWAVFDSISVVGFITNLILIPLTSFLTTPLVYLGLLALVINNTLASWVFYLVDYVLAFTLQIQSLLSEVNRFASVSSLPIALFVLLLLATIIILMPAKMPGKPLLVPVILIAILSINQPKTSERFKMVVFDIGQGLAIHISVGDKQLLYDTGYGNKTFSMAESSLLPYFKRLSISRLDRMIISHADADHAGGMNSILEKLTVDKLLVGEKTILEGADCHTEESWRWKNVQFSFLAHLPNRFYKGNSASCVLQVDVGDNKILLTGDIEKNSEKALLINGLGHFDIIVAPHHGSLTSSTIEFVTETSPNIAIFSTGYANRWQFPKSEVVQRYSDIGADIQITHKQGAIIVTESDDGALKLTTERANRLHFWQF